MVRRSRRALRHHPFSILSPMLPMLPMLPDASQPPLTLRLLEPADSIEELTDLLHRAYAEHAPAGLRFQAIDQDPRATRQRIAGGECYLALAGGRIVGTVTLYHGRGGGTPWYDHPRVARLAQLAVDPEQQGRGIAGRLMDHVEALARQRGLSEIALDTSVHATRLIEYYRRRGYRPVDHTWWATTNYRSILLSKRLGEGCPPVRIPWPRRLAARNRARLRQLWHRVGIRMKQEG